MRNGARGNLHMNRIIRNSVAALAAVGVVSATSAFAAGATRSVEEVPLLGAGVGSVAYVKGMEKSWRCTQVSDKGLNLKQSLVRTDRIGRVVLGAKGNPFACSTQTDNTAADGAAADPAAGTAAAAGTSEFVGAAVFPIELLAGVVGGGAVGAAVATSGNNDSPG